MKKSLVTVALAAAFLVSCAHSGSNLTASGLNPENFVAERDGLRTGLYTLTNADGMEVCITNFGARIVSIMVPDRDGAMRDVVLGFDTVEEYFPENNDSNFGAVIGRYANRICKGQITIDGVQYQLPQNNYGHCLHGGDDSWHYRVFTVDSFEGNVLKLSLVSPDGDNNFPGCVNASVTYTLTEDGKLELAYEATTDKTTIINMTNHSYFNLSGNPGEHSVCDDDLMIYASGYTPVDDTFMTTGEIAPVEGTPMDFRQYKKIGDDIDSDFAQVQYGKGFDHNWVLDAAGDITKPAAEVYCPATGIRLTAYTDEPGMQVYCGNFLDGSATGKKGAVYGHRHAICLESQKYPDTPNKPQWPSALLHPGETYHSHCIYAFDVVK